MGSTAPPHVGTAERFRLEHGHYVSDPRGNLIAPVSAVPGKIGLLDLDFAVRAAVTRVCSVCGIAFGDGAVYVFIQSEGREPPMHVRCALYAALACPHMRACAKEDCGWFGFILAADFRFCVDGDGSGSGEYWVYSEIPQTRMDYDRFVTYARALRENPTFGELPPE